MVPVLPAQLASWKERIKQWQSVLGFEAMRSSFLETLQDSCLCGSKYKTDFSIFLSFIVYRIQIQNISDLFDTIFCILSFCKANQPERVQIYQQTFKSLERRT
jgi:hypothetical protein